MLGRSGITYGPRAYSSPPTGLFSGRPQSMLSRSLPRKSILRHMDWLLILVVCAPRALGPLLVWSATQPGLVQQGADPRTYLKKQLLNVIIGLFLMVGVSMLDSRRLRSLATPFYIATVVALLAVLSPVGSDINGAHAQNV